MLTISTNLTAQASKVSLSFANSQMRISHILSSVSASDISHSSVGSVSSVFADVSEVVGRSIDVDGLSLIINNSSSSCSQLVPT